jgi:hypothetical protein
MISFPFSYCDGWLFSALYARNFLPPTLPLLAFCLWNQKKTYKLKLFLNDLLHFQINVTSHHNVTGRPAKGFLLWVLDSGKESFAHCYSLDVSNIISLILLTPLLWNIPKRLICWRIGPQLIDSIIEIW